MSLRPALFRMALATALSCALVAFGAPPAPAASSSALGKKVASLMKDDAVTGKGDTSGVVVVDTKTGHTEFARNATAGIAPASNMKLITVAAALDLLGKDFRFHTDVYADSSRADGVVTGDLYLKGFGDPTLSPGDLKALARQVQALGITKISGRVIADASYFDDVRINPSWRDEFYQQPDQAEVSALSLLPDGEHMPNTVGVNYQATSVGKPAKLSLTPATAAGHVKLVNKTSTSGAGSWTTIRVSRKPGSNKVTVSGRVGARRPLLTQHISVTNPARYAAQVFRGELSKLGVSVGGGIGTGKTPTDSTVRVGTLASAPLTDIVKPLMKLSVNTYSETLTKRMGAIWKQGTWVTGTERVRDWMTANDMPVTHVKLKDGSGLAASNRLTPATTMAVLRHAQQASWWDDYYDSLPVAGIRKKSIGGSLHNRMVGTAAANNVRAKTGTIRGVTALSGYATGKNGHLYAFSMLSQYAGASPVGLSDKLAVALAGWNGQ